MAHQDALVHRPSAPADGRGSPGSLAELVLARLRSRDGQEDWFRGALRGSPRPLILAEAVNSVTGIERYEDLAQVMAEVEARA